MFPFVNLNSVIRFSFILCEYNIIVKYCSKYSEANAPCYMPSPFYRNSLKWLCCVCRKRRKVLTLSSPYLSFLKSPCSQTIPTRPDSVCLSAAFRCKSSSFLPTLLVLVQSDSITPPFLPPYDSTLFPLT